MLKKLRVLIVGLAVCVLAGCGGSSSIDGALYTNYIQAVMDCSYHGDFSNYIKVVNDATADDAQQVYDDTVDYYAYQLMYYNGVNDEEISEDLYNQYVSLAKEVMSKTKYTVNNANEVEGEYQVKIDITPIDFNDITNDEIDKYYDEFIEMLSDLDTDSFTDEQWSSYEEAYGNGVLEILQKYVSKIGYKDPVSKIVIISYDEDGLFGISDQDWYDIDDYVVDMKN